MHTKKRTITSKRLSGPSSQKPGSGISLLWGNNNIVIIIIVVIVVFIIGRINTTDGFINSIINDRFQQIFYQQQAAFHLKV